MEVILIHATRVLGTFQYCNVMWSEEDVFVSLLQYSKVMEAQASITDAEIIVRFMGYERAMHRLLHQLLRAPQPCRWPWRCQAVSLVLSVREMQRGPLGLPLLGQGTWQLISKHWYPVLPSVL